MQGLKEVPLINTQGRRFDDLDAVKLHVNAQAYLGHSYFSVHSADGWPMTGFVPHAPTGPHVYLISNKWTIDPTHTASTNATFRIAPNPVKP